MARRGWDLRIGSFIALSLSVPIAIQMVLHLCITGEKRNQHKGSPKDDEYDFNDNHFPNLAVYLVMTT
jgi:hypothetical protein